MKDVETKARRLRRGAALLTAVAAFVATSLVSGAAEARRFVVGGKAFTEQYVLAEITRQMLERAGIEAETRVGFATDEIRQAQLAGDVDISWDYTWTGYKFHHGMTEWKPADQVLDELRAFDEDLGLVWLERSTVNNTYAFAVNLDYAAEACIHSMEDLAQAIRNGLDIRLASDQECHKREDCLLGAEEAYGFSIPQEKIEVMNVNDTYEALRERRAEIAVVYATDGKIPAYDLEILEDQKSVFAEYFIVPVARADALAEDPRIGPILELIARALDQDTSQELHYRVDVVGQPIEQVAAYFIASKGL
jgi:osmoprotectant transport system substrate-binding protein